MSAFIASLFFVVLAEMGDKTQLLAMAFASRYSAHKVLIAVFLATLLNHALAVVSGRFLTTLIPLEVISFIAAFSFIIFALWTLRGDKLEGEDKKKSRFGPVVTVAIAFFLAEMGDKTQLATVSLSIKYENMVSVLMGTTLGMVIADACGIIIGVVLRKHIPQKAVKWFSAVVFAFFGLAGMHTVLAARVGAVPAVSSVIIIGLITIIGAYCVVRRAVSSRV